MISLKKLGHVMLRVSDLKRSIDFYCDLLGFELLELSATGHKEMAFLTLGKSGHDIDLIKTGERTLASAKMSTLHHIAFAVDSYDDLQSAFFHLKECNVDVLKAIDHENQKSIYIKDPDENTVEIYFELPESLKLFREGRSDEAKELIFTAN